MTTLTHPERPTAVDEARASTPLLHWRQAGMAVGKLALNDGRFTIGSSPTCQVRLPGPGVKPLQCLITLEADAAQVTRWAAGILLNGREFRTAPLEPGDKLSIDGWELWFEGLCSARESPSRGARPRSTDNSPTEPTAEEAAGSTSRAIRPTPEEPFPAPTEWPAPVAPQSTKLPSGAVNDAAAWPAAPAVLVVPRAAVVAPPEPRDLAAAPTRTATLALSLPTPAAAPTPVRQLLASLNVPAPGGAGEPIIDQLRQARDAARRRCRTLVAAVRQARVDSQRAVAALASAEQALEQARQSPPSTESTPAANELPLQQPQDNPLSGMLAFAEQRVGELQAHVGVVTAQLDAARQELAEQTAQCQRLAAELAAGVAQRDQTTADRAAVDARCAELSATLAERDRRLDEVAAECDGLRRELAENRLAPPLAIETPAFNAGPDAWSSIPVLPIAASTADANDAAPPAAAASVVAWPTSTPDAVDGGGLHRSADAPSSPAPEAPSSWQAEESAAPFDRTSDGAQISWTDSAESKQEATENRAARDEAALSLIAPPESEPAREPAERLAAASVEPPRASSPAPSQPASPPSATSPSFIERYRHLLEEDERPAAEPTSRPSLPALLDEEFQTKSHAAAADEDGDADDALDAYMAKLMTRVRGDDAPTAFKSTLNPAPPSVEPPEVEESVIDEPAGKILHPELGVEMSARGSVDLEALRRQSRKQPATADLAAMREVANRSATSAIASHRDRRHVELAYTRVALSGVGGVSSALLMSNAPDLNSLQFWGGLGLAVVGCWAALQLISVSRRRDADRSAFLEADAEAN